MCRWLVIAAWIGCSSKEPGARPDTSSPPTETTSETTSPTETETSPTDTTPGTPPTLDVLALDGTVAVNTGTFATSPVCAECHGNSAGADAMRDGAGREVGMFDLWQASMMANAGRDPLWRAAVSAEVAATPAAAGTIEAKCTRCHTPMASVDAELAGAPATSLATLTDGSDRAQLALDGVSCTACHQIEPAGLGTDASYSGGFTILGAGVIFGPHDGLFSNPMVMQTGFTPTAANHVTSPELCATCHQQEVHTLGADGAETGAVVPEQAVYAEWTNSWAEDLGVTCQACHLPVVDEDGDRIVTAIARNPAGGDFPPVGDRQPYGRHVLVGGNTLIPQVLRDFGDVLQPQASDAAFDAKIALAEQQLAGAAAVTVEEPTLAGSALSFVVDVVPTTGHKLPTGIPVRRAWLHVTVTDALGAVVFTSGGWDAAGYLQGPGGTLATELAGGPVAAHLDVVDAPDEVQVWEAVLADAAGAPSWRLTRGAAWLKDNRLLPDGWDPAHPEIGWMAPVGIGADPDWTSGGDRVRFEVDVAGGAAPFTVEAEVVYQALSTRWAEELFATATPEALAFRDMWAAVDRAPERAGYATVAVP